MGGDELPRGSRRFAADHGGAFAMRRLAVYSRRPPQSRHNKKGEAWPLLSGRGDAAGTRRRRSLWDCPARQPPYLAM